MSFLSGLGSILGTAAPLVGTLLGGPVGGAIGSLAGSYLSGGNANGNANNAAGTAGGIANGQAALYNKYSPEALNAMLTQSGIDPTTGSFNPSYNPAQTLYDSQYSPTTIASNASRLFDPAQLGNEMAGYKSASAPNYTAATTSAIADATNRGFGGADSALDSNIAGIRRAQVGDQSQFNTGLLANLANQSRQYQVGQQTAGQNLLSTGLQDQQNNLKSTENTLQQTAQGATGTLGGLQGFYANQGAATGNGITSAIGQLASSGGLGDLFGSIFGGRKQSQSPGTTNAQSPSGGVGNAAMYNL